MHKPLKTNQIPAALSTPGDKSAIGLLIPGFGEFIFPVTGDSLESKIANFNRIFSTEQRFDQRFAASPS